MGTTANTVMSLTATSGGTDGIIIETWGNVGMETSTTQKKLHNAGSGATSEMPMLVSRGDATGDHKA